jgi:RNA polymerase-binding transcription factor DksA
MPEGVVQWFDVDRGVGRVVRGSREYPVSVDEVEPRARVAGARVRFDVVRHDGVEMAASVVLREGSRVGRGKRRFGDLSGARRVDSKGSAPFARPHPELGRGLVGHPEVVAQRWGEQVIAGDLDAAVLLYAPDAVVHAGEEALKGRRVHGWLSTSGLLGHVRGVESRGVGDDVVELRWVGREGRLERTWLRVARGEIVEQWIGVARPPQEMLARGRPGGWMPPVEVVALDASVEGVRGRAEEKVRGVMDRVGERILFARVKLGVAPNPAVERPAWAQATLDVNGDLVRAQVAAYSPAEAVDLLVDRLRDRLEHRAEHRRALRGLPALPEPGSWRRGQLRTERPEWFERPPEEREIVRQKTFSLGESTVEEAVFDLEMLGHDFYLFREFVSGGDAMVYLLPGDGYGLQRLHPTTGDGEDGTEAGVYDAATVEVAVDPSAPPTLTVDGALEWLQVGKARFVFFREADSGRGNVAYMRYDGNYGLIAPAEEPAPPSEPAMARRRLRAELGRLTAVRTALLREALDEDTQSGQVGETSSLDQHQADHGTETFERERDLSLLEDIEAEISDVERALVHLNQGTYGYCEACGTPIPPERLEAVPATRFCLEHQAEAEIIPGLAQ